MLRFLKRAGFDFSSEHHFAVYNESMAKDVIHISEAEAATTNVATLLAHVRAGAEVVIENDAVARGGAALCGAASGPVCSRNLSRLAEAHGFYRDARRRLRPRSRRRSINSHREPLNPPAWD